MRVAQAGTVPHLACQHEYTGRLLPATPCNAAPLPQLLLRLQLVLVLVCVVGDDPWQHWHSWAGAAAGAAWTVSGRCSFWCRPQYNRQYRELKVPHDGMCIIYAGCRANIQTSCCYCCCRLCCCCSCCFWLCCSFRLRAPSSTSCCRARCIASDALIPKSACCSSCCCTRAVPAQAVWQASLDVARCSCCSISC